MNFRKIQNRSVDMASQEKLDQPRRLTWGRAAICLVAVGVFALAARPIQQGTAPPDKGSIYSPYLTTPPDANEQMRMREQAQKQQDFTAINAQRKKQIADDSAMLLKLATDLKDEVDKTNKDTLSITVIRKADAVEKLAHSLKEKMKLSVGAS